MYEADCRLKINELMFCIEYKLLKMYRRKCNALNLFLLIRVDFYA